MKINELTALSADVRFVQALCRRAANVAVRDAFRRVVALELSLPSLTSICNTTAIITIN